MNHILLTLLSLGVFIFTTGCSISPKYRVSIDAITAKNIAIAPSTYDIKALDTNKNTESLVFQQHSETLTQVLKQKGYTQVPLGQIGKQTIYFDYGIDKVNEETETYSEPNIFFNMGWGRPFGGYYGMYNPFYGGYYGGGYSTYQKTYIYYNRYVTLLAKDTSNKDLWRVDVSSVGESKNLKKIIPILIEAAAPYLGVNTPEPIQLIIKTKPKKK